MKQLVKDLELQERAAQAALSEVRAKLFAARCDDAGLHVGDIVSYPNYKKEATIFKVAKISFYSYSGNPSVEGCKKLKSGGWHQNAQYLGFDWTKVEEQSDTNPRRLSIAGVYGKIEVR